MVLICAKNSLGTVKPCSGAASRPNRISGRISHQERVHVTNIFIILHSGTFWPILKVIVSRDFDVCLLVPLDRSDTASPDRTGSLKKKCQFRVEFSIIRVLALVVSLGAYSRISSLFQSIFKRQFYQGCFE
jgi:hypothetical protein